MWGVGGRGGGVKEVGTRGDFTYMLCSHNVYHVYHPSPYRQAVVGFFTKTSHRVLFSSTAGGVSRLFTLVV